MAKRGRPRKPDNLRILDGDHPERLNIDAPVSPLGVGDPPKFLDKHAKEAWRRLVDKLAEMKVLARADHDAMMIYCDAYSTWRKTTEAIAKDGMTVVGGSGGMKPHPLFAVQSNAIRTMTSILAHFGMTPSARASLKMQPEPEDDPLASFADGLRQRNREGRGKVGQD